MTVVRKEITLATIVLALILVSSAMASAITGSMGNARMVLYPSVDGSKEVRIDKTILVKNVNSDPINVTLIADSDAVKFLQVVDNSFILAPDSEKNARFTIKVKNEGKYEGKINVFFKNQTGKDAGVVLSSTVIVIAKKNQTDPNTNIENSTDDSTNDQTSSSGITGNVVGSGGKKISTGAIFLIVTTVLLLIVLVALIVVAPKKLKSSKALNGKNGRGKK